MSDVQDPARIQADDSLPSCSARLTRSYQLLAFTSADLRLLPPTAGSKPRPANGLRLIVQIDFTDQVLVLRFVETERQNLHPLVLRRPVRVDRRRDRRRARERGLMGGEIVGHDLVDAGIEALSEIFLWTVPGRHVFRDESARRRAAVSVVRLLAVRLQTVPVDVRRIRIPAHDDAELQGQIAAKRGVNLGSLHFADPVFVSLAPGEKSVQLLEREDRGLNVVAATSAPPLTRRKRRVMKKRERFFK